jgi:hypothetical protein
MEILTGKAENNYERFRLAKIYSCAIFYKLISLLAQNSAGVYFQSILYQ